MWDRPMNCNVRVWKFHWYIFNFHTTLTFKKLLFDELGVTSKKGIHNSLKSDDLNETAPPFLYNRFIV